jgi:hypothetical protein
MTTPQDDGGPAFPIPGGGCLASGISIRDYFAAAALNGILANSGGPLQSNGMTGWGWTNCDQTQVTQAVYGIADDMLAARKAER